MRALNEHEISEVQVVTKHQVSQLSRLYNYAQKLDHKGTHAIGRYNKLFLLLIHTQKSLIFMP